MTLTLYGIASCDSCRKARKWLDGQGIAHRWVDIRTDSEGLPGAVLARALDALEPKRLVNKSSKTWRELSEAEKDRANGGARDAVLAVLTEHPTLMKRPLIVTDGWCEVGFTPANQKQLETLA